MPNILIVRHGNTFDKGDTVTRVGGRTDLPLSSSGIEQAIALGEHFRGVEFDAAFCSVLRRTRETAHAILTHSPQSPPLLIAPFLKEVDYGPDENKPETDVVARIGKTALEAWEQDATPPEGWVVDADGLRAAWRAFLDRARDLPDDSNTLVVTSNGIARFLPDIVDTKPETIDRKLKTGAFGTIYVDSSGRSEIVNWNVRP